MATSATQLHARGRASLGPLGKLTVAVLAGIALIVIYAMVVVVGRIDPMALAFALIVAP